MEWVFGELRLDTDRRELQSRVIKDLLAGSGLVVEPAGTLQIDHVGPHPVYRWIR